MRHCGLRSVTVFSVLLISFANAGPDTLRTKTHVPVEIEFRARAPHADPFNDLDVNLVVSDPAGRTLRIPCFWAGGETWKARYASGIAGVHPFRTEASAADDRGLHGVEGRIEVEPYDGENVLYRRGPIRVAPDRRHIEHADGTPFFWLGDTWWMGLCQRLRFPDEFAKLASDRVGKGFTIIQIVAGLYPDMPAFDERGANEAGFPWEKDWSKIRPAYFDAADRRLAHLVDAGLVPCIVGAWGYFLPWMGVEKAKKHWRYLVARYGAWPVVWCIAGEANLPYYLVKGFPFHEAEQVKGWTEVMRYVRDIDPFRRLVTIHPTGIGRLSARGATEDVSLLDFDMLQTPHGEREAIPPTARTARTSYGEEPTMPVINGEASYEHLMDRIPALYPRAMFWVCMMEGAAGHTYGANGIWQCNRRGQPHGTSPHGGSYGTIPWDEAMELAGSRQVGLGKRLLERFRWFGFAPHPEWAEYEGAAGEGLAGCHWIWFPEGEPARDAPAEERLFRKTFVLPDGKAVASAILLATADDAFAARLNGQAAGSGADWHRIHRFDVARLLRPGENAVVIAARNGAASVPANPAGLIACLEIRFADGSSMRIASDGAWQAAKDEAKGWVAAKDLGALGMQPWGMIGGHGEFDGPHAAGIPGSVRIIYVPFPETIIARHLGADAEWTATYFDPVDGRETRIGAIRADPAGRWRCPAPAGAKDDWVLILEAGSSPTAPRAQTIIESDAVAWHLDTGGGRPRALLIVNKLSGKTYAISGGREIALTFSAAPDRIAEPLARIDEFEPRGADPKGPGHAVFRLASASPAIDVTLHYAVEGPVRRKWVEVTNRAGRDLLLLDVELDDFATEGATTGGGQGQPVFIDGEIFAAIEHPSGVNEADRGRVRLLHRPGRRIPAGGTFRSRDAIVAVAPAGHALDEFLSYIEARSLRRPRTLAIYTPFGINNQWGGCPTLDEEQTLDVLDLLESWREKGVRFDYFTLDTGWSDPGDLMRFRPACFPDGPARIVERAEALGMKFGLWFATSWAAESCWDDARAMAGQAPLVMPYRNGYPDKARTGRMFCFACPAYYEALRRAVLHHIREDHVRFVKFDGGSYACDDPSHGHLPGPYSTERMHDLLIELSEAARAAAPDVFVMWYWGLRSPFWALHGHTIFESGVHLEGSGTSAFPALHYRDSVTLAQDQAARAARTIPPIAKDSLGVWLADTRWGNFMGAERWREALAMDLGRGSLLFPNLWGDIYQLSGGDVEFLARMTSLARRDEALFARRRAIAGDPWRNEVYGYACARGARGYLFLNNAHFAARRAIVPLDGSAGLDAPPGTRVEIASHFPDRARIPGPDPAGFAIGDRLEVWLRPFEVLMLEVGPAGEAARGLPVRDVTRERAESLGTALELGSAPLDPSLDVRLADEARFEAQGLRRSVRSFEATLPAIGEGRTLLAVPIRLRRGDAEWRRAPAVVEIVQAVARIGDERVQLIPVPDARQFGNTQASGCSWVLFKTPLARRWSGAGLRLAVIAHLPDGVEARVEAWVVRRWWEAGGRPIPDGYYNDAPS